MSTQVTKQNSKAGQSRSGKIDQYVSKQLKQTMQQVRVSDSIAALIALLVFVIGYFIVAAIVDAWIWPLSTTGRVIAFAGLLLGIGFILWRMFLPLAMRKINPQFAAKMIEESKPTFKNSLLNYLSLRQKESNTRRAVLNEVTRQAAKDLQTVTLENAVDRSNVIRMGFALVAISALAIVYSVLSPKNPLQTVGRILAPVSKMAKPAVVRITDVNPGDTDVFFGDHLEVTAEINGRHDPGDVRLLFSTRDGQLMDVNVPMQPGESKTQYVATLSTGPAGIQSPLTYWIEARDGRSPDFDVNVRTNPSISINEVTITPPAYTRLQERTLEGQGEIQCPEGSQISIRATANLPIKLAYIELLQAKSDAPDNEDFRSEEIEMTLKGRGGREATGRFKAVLNSKRTKQKFTHYRVRFVSEKGFRNENPNIYPIRVIADLGPEVEIVRPTEKEITLPVNQPLLVEVRAEDLDFEISSVDLHFDHQGTALLDRNLHLQLKSEVNENGIPGTANGRVTAESVFSAEKFNLEPGDRVIMHAKAADNRMSVNNLPAPNVSYTDNYTLIITEPVANPRQPKKSDDGQDKKNEQQPTERKKQDSSDQESDSSDSGDGDSEEKSQGGGDSDSTGDEGQSQEQQGGSSEDGNSDGSEQSQSDDGDSGSKDSGDGGESQNESQGGSEDESDSGNSSGGKKSEDGNSENQNQNQPSANGSQSDEGSSGASGDSQSQADNAREQGGGASPEGQRNDDAPNQGSSGDSQSSDGTDSQGSSDNRQSGDGGSSRDSQADGEGNRDNSLNDGQQEPLSKDATEREKFERLKEWMDKQGEESPDQSGDTDGTDSQNDGEGDGQKTGRQKPGQEGGNSNPTEQQPHDSPKSSGESGSGDNQTSEEKSQDGNPQQGAKNGAQSEDGSPDAGQEGNSDQTDGGDGSQDSQGSKYDGGQKGNQQKDGNDSQAGGDSQKGDEPGSGDSKSDDQNNKGDQKSGDQKPGEGQQPGEKKTDGGAGGEDPGQQGAGREGGQQGSEAGAEGQGAGGAEGSGESGSPGESPSSGEGQGAEGGAGGQPSGTSSESEPTNNSKGSPGSGGGSGGGKGNPDGPIEKADAANLDYAKKATDLILNELEDDEFDPSEELLDNMNMSREELDEFVRRWQEMKKNARTNNKSKRQYEDALRALNLKPKTRVRKVKAKKDNLRGLSEDSSLDQVPAGVNVDEFHEYLKSLNRASRNRK